MALLQVNFYSRVLDRGVCASVILPEKKQGVGVEESPLRVNPAVWDGETELKTLYLLHGWSDDHTIWCRRTSIERYAAGKNLAIIMPSVGNSFYTDEVNGYDYWRFMTEDLPAAMESFFKLSGRREDTYAAGLSMGGYGALKLGLRCPDRFCKVASLSGVLDLEKMFQRKTPEENSFLRRVFGDDKHPQAREEDDILYLAKALNASGAQKPEIYLSCGDKDELYDDYLSGCKLFSQLGYSLTTHTAVNEDHCWRLWDQEIQRVLDWMEL